MAFRGGRSPGAHGLHPDGTRTLNVSHPEEYLTRQDPSIVQERPTPKQRAIDRLLSGLRTTRGISLEQLAFDTGFSPNELCLRGLERGGVLNRKSGHIRLTQNGFPVADGIISRLTESLEPHPTFSYRAESR